MAQLWGIYKQWELKFDEWSINEKFWVFKGISSLVFPSLQNLLKVLAFIDPNYIVTSKPLKEDGEFS